MKLSRRRLYALLQFGGWGAHAVISILFFSAQTPLTWRMVGICVFEDALAGLCSHLLRGIIRRRRWLDRGVGALTVRIFAASIAGGIAVTVVSALASVFVFRMGTLRANNLAWLPIAVFVWSICLFLWAVIYCGVHFVERLRNAEIEKLHLAVLARDAEHRALLQQLNPHFMFNCLNSIRALITEDPARARDMIDELAGILRYSLQAGKQETVTLASEMEAVRTYLDLEAIRFEERLRVELEIAPESLDARIPPMLVQTLVENGVRHGIATLPEGGSIQVSASVDDGSLRIRVLNSGGWAPRPGHDGVGLPNARERLRLLHGDRATFRVGENGHGLVLAEVSLPFMR